MDGSVKFFKIDRRYGFVVGTDGQDYFLHASEILNEDKIRKGDQVKFEPSKSERGLLAKQVQLVEVKL